MGIKLKISPRLIPSIASLYNDVNRILLEYIDNSLDSAEVHYNRKLGIYNKKIRIDIKIQGASNRDGKVIIQDNCRGIDNMKKVVQSIGNSDKKAQAWTNGQFGYGIYSFMAGCERLEITSKFIDHQPLFIPIEKSRFNADKQEDVVFPDLQEKSIFHSDTGTEIILSKFGVHTWRQIKAGNIKAEIEKHFEVLLNRKNLYIYIVNKQGKSLRCRTYNYDANDGEIFQQDITRLPTFKGRKIRQPFDLLIDPPIKVYLKLTKGVVLNKPPIFIMKGRRIGEIKEIRAFRSSHKSDIWGHPNLTGYIDLGDQLEPTIARNDFKNTQKSKAIFKKLFELEPIILEFIQDINKKSAERHYKVLEDYLNTALSKLARVDAMKYRNDILQGTDISLEPVNIDEESGITLHATDTFIGQNKGEEQEPHDKEDQQSEDEENEPLILLDRDKEGKEFKEAEQQTTYKASKRKQSGFNICIVDREPDINAATNKPEKSRLVEDTIEIFRKHPSFEERVTVNRKGEQIISHRLITYLAGEITVHYKDAYHIKNGPPQYNKYLFSDLVDFIYRIEGQLLLLEGKNLASL